MEGRRTGSRGCKERGRRGVDMCCSLANIDLPIKINQYSMFSLRCCRARKERDEKSKAAVARLFSLPPSATRLLRSSRPSLLLMLPDVQLLQYRTPLTLSRCCWRGSSCGGSRARFKRRAELGVVIGLPGAHRGLGAAAREGSVRGKRGKDEGRGRTGQFP